MKKTNNYHEKFNSFYNSPEWKKLRKQEWKDANGLCEMCLKNGIITEAREIHHIIPIEQDWNKRFNYDNLIALCPQCHQNVHDRDSQLQKFLRFWNSV